MGWRKRFWWVALAMGVGGFAAFVQVCHLIAVPTGSEVSIYLWPLGTIFVIGTEVVALRRCYRAEPFGRAGRWQLSLTGIVSVPVFTVLLMCAARELLPSSVFTMKYNSQSQWSRGAYKFEIVALILAQGIGYAACLLVASRKGMGQGWRTCFWSAGLLLTSVGLMAMGGFLFCILIIAILDGSHQAWGFVNDVLGGQHEAMLPFIHSYRYGLSALFLGLLLKWSAESLWVPAAEEQKSGVMPRDFARSFFEFTGISFLIAALMLFAFLGAGAGTWSIDNTTAIAIGCALPFLSFIAVYALNEFFPDKSGKAAERWRPSLAALALFTFFAGALFLPFAIDAFEHGYAPWEYFHAAAILNLWGALCLLASFRNGFGRAWLRLPFTATLFLSGVICAAFGTILLGALFNLLNGDLGEAKAALKFVNPYWWRRSASLRGSGAQLLIWAALPVPPLLCWWMLRLRRKAAKSAPK